MAAFEGLRLQRYKQLVTKILHKAIFSDATLAEFDSSFARSSKNGNLQKTVDQLKVKFRSILYTFEGGRGGMPRLGAHASDRFDYRFST